MQTVEQRLRAALTEVGRKLMAIEGTVPIAKEAQRIALAALQSLPPSAPVDLNATALALDAHRVVPVEPTEAMLEAGEEARRENTDTYFDGSEVAGDVVPAIWAAMLSALPPSAPELPDDVRRLVVAAREFWDDNNDHSQESQELDKALEAFASRVPYANQPEVSHEA